MTYQNEKQNVRSNLDILKQAELLYLKLDVDKDETLGTRELRKLVQWSCTCFLGTKVILLQAPNVYKTPFFFNSHVLMIGRRRVCQKNKDKTKIFKIWRWCLTHPPPSTG